jgi:hypothetical protein
MKARPFALFVLALSLALLAGSASARGAILAGGSPASGVLTGNTLYTAPAGSGDCSSWAQACTLQTALANAVAGDEIWVQAGVHKPTTDPLNRGAAFHMANGVALYGGFAGIETVRDQRSWQLHMTVLSGDIDGNDTTDANGVVTEAANIQGGNSYHVVISENLDASAVLDGFFITAGQSNFSGGGMYNNYSNPSLANLVLSGNTASQGGGGMYNWGAAPALANVTFAGNTTPQTGGGMYSSQGSSPSLVNVTFRHNSARWGGGMHSANSTATLTNGTFCGNTASYGGGGMFNQSSSPTLRNVTFYDNDAVDSGGGIYNFDHSSPSLANVILWDDSAPMGPEIFKDGSSAPAITYSDVQGGYGGAGNVNADPLFVDAANDNLRLQSTSPAIDAGNNGAVPAGITTDLDDNPRFVDLPSVPDTGNGTPPIVDMGAYEAYDDSSAPMVVSSTRFDANPTSAARVRFLVTFSERVVGIDAGDFGLTADGVSGASVVGVSGAGATYLLAVATGSGQGTLRLDVPGTAGLADLRGNPATGLPFESGEAYDVNHGFQVFLPVVLRGW